MRSRDYVTEIGALTAVHGFALGRKPTLRRLILNLLVGLLIALTFPRPNAFAADGHWVTTWGCGPQLTNPGNLPPAPLANGTLRQFVHTTMGGKLLRVRFSNAYGTNSVAISLAHVALSVGAGSAGNGDINSATDKALTFRGAPSIVIPPGEAILSDPCDFNLPALTNLAVTIHFGGVSTTTITGHPGSRTTSFIQSGNVVSATNLPAASKTLHWYIITGVEVLADAPSFAVVTLGDSITDGRGSTNDMNTRWPDYLAARLHTNPPTAGVAVANMGIGANAVLGGSVTGGPSVLARFDRDVLTTSGVRWLIVFEGVNDIGGGAPAANLINAYTQFANKAHARNLRAYGATITPFGGNGYYTPAHETVRQTVNAWFRTNNLYDGVIDFDAAVRDPVTLTNFLPIYENPDNDHLHLNGLGYEVMANAIDLDFFAP